MNAKTDTPTPDDIETATEHQNANGAEAADDQDRGAIAAQAARLAQPQPEPLDPNRPMHHLVTPIIMQDVLSILKRLPFEDVQRVMPALQSAPIYQVPKG